MPELEETIKKTGWWGEAGINAANVAMSATETSTTNSRILGIDPMNKRALARKTLSPSSCLIFILLVKACNYWVNIQKSMVLMNQTVSPFLIVMRFGIWKQLAVITGLPKEYQMIVMQLLRTGLILLSFDFNSDDTMASADLEEMIQNYHLDLDQTGNPYNLRHIFGSHADSDYEYNIPRQWYIQKLFNPSEEKKPNDPELPFAKKPEHLLTIEDFKYALSSRYQNTVYDPYGKEETEQDHQAFRPIGFQRNQELSILQIRNDVPKDIAGVQWLALGPNAFNGIAPYYVNILDTPAVYRTNC